MSIGLPPGVPPYSEFGDLEEISHLWHKRPDRWRQKTDHSDGSGTKYRVADGIGPWWFYGVLDGAYRVAHYSPSNRRGEFTPDTELSCLLDPCEIRHGLDNCILNIVGRAGLLGRESIEVEAKAISWDYAPSGPFWECADGYQLSVDAEIGAILRFASRLRGHERNSFEIIELAFDETFPDGTFALEPARNRVRDDRSTAVEALKTMLVEVRTL